MKRSWWIYAGLLVIVAATVLAASLYFKPRASVEERDTDFRLSAAELTDAFLRDESVASARYVGKVLEVSGAVTRVARESGSVLVSLRGTEDTTGVTCYLRDDAVRSVTELKPGQPVTVKGICNGLLLDVVLDQCIVVSGGN